MTTGCGRRTKLERYSFGIYKKEIKITKYSPYGGWQDSDWDEVIPGMYVGACEYTDNQLCNLQEAKIGVTVDCRDIDIENLESTFEARSYGVTRFPAPTEDDLTCKLEDPWIYNAIGITTEAYEAGSKVLVHCSAGFNRSPSVAYGVLRLIGYSLKSALFVVKGSREVGLAYGLEAEFAACRILEDRAK